MIEFLGTIHQIKTDSEGETIIQLKVPLEGLDQVTRGSQMLEKLLKIKIEIEE